MAGAPLAEYGQVGAEDGQAPPRDGAPFGWSGAARALVSLAVLGALAVAVALSPPGRLLRARGVSEMIGLQANELYECTGSYGKGQGSWETIWSDEQQEWCCENKQLGCTTPPLFDCEADYEDRRLAWSPIKKAWCCNNADASSSAYDPACPENQCYGCADLPCRASPGVLAPGTTLYCVTISRPIDSGSYEPKLLMKQLQECVHIFSCDEFSVVSDKVFRISDDPEVTTLRYDGPDLSDVAGALDNSAQFRGFWDRIIKEGRYKLYDWTVKSDPDTVFFPDRLKARLSENRYSGDDSTFFASCGRESTNGMQNLIQGNEGFLFGAMEVISRAALAKYFEGLGDCEWADKKKSHEEITMFHCMENAGVEINFGMLDHKFLGDGDVCNNFYGPACTGEWVAMHNYSGEDAWFNCWKESTSWSESTIDPMAQPAQA